jgi:hypothetical protein
MTMHSSFEKQVASTESGEIIGVLWTRLLFGNIVHFVTSTSLKCGCESRWESQTQAHCVCSCEIAQYYHSIKM